MALPAIDEGVPRLILPILFSPPSVQTKTGVLHIGSLTLAFYSDERVMSCWDMFLHLDLEGSMRFVLFCFFVVSLAIILWSSKFSLSPFSSVNRFISLI